MLSIKHPNENDCNIACSIHSADSEADKAISIENPRLEYLKVERKEARKDFLCQVYLKL